MVELTEGEGIFSLRATFGGSLPQGEGMHATRRAVGAPIVVTQGISSGTGKTWILSKYGDPALWYITKPSEGSIKGFHYDRVEAGSAISLGYPSPFFLDLCANGTGGVFRPVVFTNGVACRSNHCVGVSEKGTVEITSLAIPTDLGPGTPAWQARTIPSKR